MKFIFKPLLIVFVGFLLIGCGKDDEQEDGLIEGAEYFFEGMIGDEAILHNDSDRLAISYEQQSTDGYECYVSYGGYLGALGATVSDPNNVSVIFSNVALLDGFCNVLEEIRPIFNTLFEVGDYDFLSNEEEEELNRITIYYVDRNKVLWESFSGIQSNSSSFKVTKSEVLAEDAFGRPQKKISGTLNCTLYDFEGNTKELTNGKFTLNYTYQ